MFKACRSLAREMEALCEIMDTSRPVEPVKESILLAESHSRPTITLEFTSIQDMPIIPYFQLDSGSTPMTMQKAARTTIESLFWLAQPALFSLVGLGSSGWRN